MTTTWKLYDNYGEPLRWRFSSKEKANQFKFMMGRPDWTAKQIK